MLCSRVTRPTLCPAISEPPSTSPSMTARRRRRPRNARFRAAPPSATARRALKRSMTSRWIARNRSVAGLASARTGITGKRGSSCTRRHRVARRGADEGLLEARMGDRFMGADKAGAELHAGRAHFEIGQRSPRRGRCRRRRTPAPRRDAAGSPAPAPPVETGPIWPPASLPSMTIASAPMRTSFFAIDQRRREADHARAAVADARDRRRARQAAGQHDMADALRRADVDQLGELRVQRDQIDAERPRRSAPRSRRSRRPSRSGDIAPEAITPKPPALEIAATRLRSDTQVIAPPMIARSQPRKARPRAHSRSSSARARLAVASPPCAQPARDRRQPAFAHPAASSP